MRRLVLLTALIVGVGIGAVASSALRDDTAVARLPVAEPATATVTTVPVPTDGVLLAWVPGGLPPMFGEQLRDDGAFDGVTVVLGDTVHLASSMDAEGRPVDAPDAGRVIPLDAIAIDCVSWSAIVPVAEAESVCGLADDEALLGTASARLRRLGVGGSITLANGRVLRVAGVVADEVVGAAELVVSTDGAGAIGVDTPRYALAAYAGDRAEAERRIRSAAGDVALRVRGPGETPWLRHGDAVLPASLLKLTFGEFSARDAGGGVLAIDPAWESANLVTEDVPVLGRVRCHHALMTALQGALTELADRGLLTSVDRRAAGCWNPRTIAGTDQPSRHAWGAAVDLVPLPADTDELVAVMERWGFTWGGRWVSPDPEHFEYVRPPTG